MLGAAGWDAARRLDYDRVFELASTAVQLMDADPDSGWSTAYAAVCTAGVTGIDSGRFEEAIAFTDRFLADHAASGEPENFVHSAAGVVPVVSSFLTGDSTAAVRERREPWRSLGASGTPLDSRCASTSTAGCT